MQALPKEIAAFCHRPSSFKLCCRSAAAVAGSGSGVAAPLADALSPQPEVLVKFSLPGGLIVTSLGPKNPSSWT